MYMGVLRRMHELQFYTPMPRDYKYGRDKLPKVLWSIGISQIKGASQEVQTRGAGSARGCVFFGGARIRSQHEREVGILPNIIQPYGGRIEDEFGMLELGWLEMA